VRMTALDRLKMLEAHLVPLSTENQMTLLNCAAIDDYTPPPITLHHEDIPEDQRIGLKLDTVRMFAKPRKFRLPDETEVTIQFRRYVEGEDDDKFQRLDAQCKQGNKTQLETKFTLRKSWVEIQGKTDSVVAVDVTEPNEIAAITRSFRKWVFLNGKPIPISYHFLIRVAPKYRGSGMAELVSRILLGIDYSKGVRYFLGYSVEDNVKTLALQERIVNSRPLQEDMQQWRVRGFMLKNALEKLKVPTELKKKIEVYRTESVREQVEFTKKIFERAQLLPVDLHNIFRSPLSEGTFIARMNDKKEALASFSVWNSGEVRSNKLPSMENFLEQPCVIYNFWQNPDLPREQGRDILATLLLLVVEKMHEMKAHDFAYCFLLNNSPLIPLFEWAEFIVNWKTRMWYWDAATRFDPKTGTDIVYDPRDSLH